MNLIGFIRDLSKELEQRADVLDEEAKALPNRTQLDHDAVVSAVAEAATLRHVACAVAAAAKRTLLT